jgi:hypothetical protein
LTPGDRREDTMAEYWVAMDISRSAALKTLEELADPKSKLRRDLEKSKQSARKALAARNIYISEDSLPDVIKLPAPEQIATLRMQARAMVGRDRRPFGFFILAAVLGAMPVVDGAD